MTAHDVDESAPIDRYDVASRLLDAAAQAALKGRYDRVQAHATRALAHAVLALVDVITHATAGRCPCSCRATSKGSEGK